MKKLLLFAGTTEGRTLSEVLSQFKIFHTVCVATEYGEILLSQSPYAKILKGRMNEEEMKALIQNDGYSVVVDATHPYAEVVTNNIKNAAKETAVTYLRFKRDIGSTDTYEKIYYFSDNESCAKALLDCQGNILLTTGCKELPIYTAHESLLPRLFVRVLPSIESIGICNQHGIHGKQILAMQGPFNEQMNDAMLSQYQISCLVTKKSGKSGGYEEKIAAAQKANLPVYVIGAPKEDQGFSFDEILEKLSILYEKTIKSPCEFKVTLVGIGMGNQDTLTLKAKQTIAEADFLLGANRMLAPYTAGIEKKPFYLAKEVIPYLKQQQRLYAHKGLLKVVVLFSGDTGFYSGTQKLYEALQEEIKAKTLNAQVEILPGISSISYLSSCAGVSYEDAQILSMHGKPQIQLGEQLMRNKKTFLITSGAEDIRKIGHALLQRNAMDAKVMVGINLSYPEEDILTLSPRECCEFAKEGLITCVVINPMAKGRRLTHGLSDDRFFRGQVPMTKEEVREVCLCKLKLCEGDIVYDIGSGTGSIAVEIARISETLSVYAIEQKEEAVTLINRNKEKFTLDNLEIIHAKAPQGIESLAPATHAFIGGSSGNLDEILMTLYQKNPNMRVVMTAISLETIAEFTKVSEVVPICNEEIVVLQASRAKKAGKYHLMQAENPVYVCSFDFDLKGRKNE